MNFLCSNIFSHTYPQPSHSFSGFSHEFSVELPTTQSSKTKCLRLLTLHVLISVLRPWKNRRFPGFLPAKIYQWLIVVYTMLYLLLVSDVEDTLNWNDLYHGSSGPIAQFLAYWPAILEFNVEFDMFHLFIAQQTIKSHEKLLVVSWCTQWCGWFGTISIHTYFHL